MIQSLYTSISGMKSFQEALSVTSNNIANAQTIGFKKQKAMFDDLLYQSAAGSKSDGKYAGTNARSVGTGVKLSSINTDYSSGSLTLTGGKTDVALEGNGFFLLGDASGANPQYTRKGAFNVSADFRIVNAEGKYVMGYPADPATGNIKQGGVPQPIELPMGTAVGGIKTDTATMSGNLPKDGTTIQFPFYDDAGNKLVMELKYTPATDTEKQAAGLAADESMYTYNATVQNPDGSTAQAGSGSITFNANGTLKQDPNVDPAQIPSLDLTYGGSPVSLKIGGMTNYPTDKTMKVTDISGRQAAVAMDYSITDGGYVMVKYSDGTMKAAAQLAVATFPNEKGLVKTGSGNYIEGPAAGAVAYGVSGQNGAGQVRGGATEGSNVDLSTEFVDLMVYQRGFQGNSKVIKVADDVMNDIVNLIR
ncbi:flagellar hook protein FlgE [Ectobacillus ponti]|uniref:Flagellar hook protein FlgE n=1 Tax=Ectobacillus ponti TaxID=2961894 RepID=A0AA41XB85_9BACI|nr:flagellar hook protein FlgE [Ectobacillus ponti]MCP8968851.1 flagellar hook protein FlgE [Ectobacillus ponti]